MAKGLCSSYWTLWMSTGFLSHTWRILRVYSGRRLEQSFVTGLPDSNLKSSNGTIYHKFWEAPNGGKYMETCMFCAFMYKNMHVQYIILLTYQPKMIQWLNVKYSLKKLGAHMYIQVPHWFDNENFSREGKNCSRGECPAPNESLVHTWQAPLVPGLPLLALVLAPTAGEQRKQPSWSSSTAMDEQEVQTASHEIPLGQNNISKHQFSRLLLNRRMKYDVHIF